ncbi:MAG TPA: helix-turn-helix domain-containing protein, partial [Devosia sp.]|nr:helix-turn-helix domain-containing protein [Devosia sp.]
MSRNFLVIDPEEKPDVLRALASEVRISILKVLHVVGPLNLNDIAARLSQPQSTISSNMQVLVDAGLVRTETQKARKG